MPDAGGPAAFTSAHSQTLSSATSRIALERPVSRIQTRRRIMRNAWIAAAFVWLLVWIGVGSFFGERYPFIAEWSFILGGIAALAALVLTARLQLAMDGRTRTPRFRIGIRTAI